MENIYPLSIINNDPTPYIPGTVEDLSLQLPNLTQPLVINDQSALLIVPNNILNDIKLRDDRRVFGRLSKLINKAISENIIWSWYSSYNIYVPVTNLIVNTDGINVICRTD